MRLYAPGGPAFGPMAPVPPFHLAGLGRERHASDFAMLAIAGIDTLR